MVRLSAVINELVEEKGIDRATLNMIVCEGLLAAYEKRFPDLLLRARYQEKEGDIVIDIEKEIVSVVEDDDKQISIRKARSLDPDAKSGDKIWVLFDGKIGRIEILRAKQVIANRVRKIEATAIYDEFKSKAGSIVHGVIHKVEHGGVVVKIQETLAFLPKSLSIPGEKLIVGYPIRALLKEVLLEPRGDNQLILDRSSEEFLLRLFELEIPEVFERLVEIKKVVRIPGYKSKVVVVSNDKNIDPVGTCVGVGGIRIRPILKELGGEKIDVIAWTENLQEFIKNALKPAKINNVELVDDENAHIWLDEDERSLAIGKMGQNIALASRLAGIKIHLVQENQGRGGASDRRSSEE
jgi:N utilization substance protein A